MQSAPLRPVDTQNIYEIINAACELGRLDDLTSETTLAALMALQGEERARAEAQLRDAATRRACKTEFNRLLTAHKRGFAQEQRDKMANRVALSNPPPELAGLTIYCGAYQCRDSGVTMLEYDRDAMPREIPVCTHPILPVEYLCNVVDEAERVRIAFYKQNRWKHITIERRALIDKRAILELGARGVDVTSERAGALVQYFATIEAQNESIPRLRSTSRLGWINETEFLPYIDNVRFDGDAMFASLFECVRPGGDYAEWLECMIDVRRHGGPAKVMLAAAFASVIVALTNGTPFFTHLWGGSETGKTVALMVAASVWGDPNPGKLLRSFSSTRVGMEFTAAFLNALPACFDELETAAQSEDFSQTIYMLTEGTGKTRGRADGGIQRQLTWRNIFLTTGEKPLTTEMSRAGAKNRVFDLECAAPLFEHPAYVAETVKLHHGHAGKIFVDGLIRMGAERLRLEHQCAVRELRACETPDAPRMDKQRVSAAYLLIADRIATDLVFKDNNFLSPCELVDIQKTVSATTNAENNWNWLQGWVAQNEIRFRSYEAGNNGEVWGRMQDVGEWDVAIIGTVLREHMSRAGISYDAFLSDAARGQRIIPGNDGKSTRVIRFGAKMLRCVAVRGLWKPPVTPSAQNVTSAPNNII